MRHNQPTTKWSKVLLFHGRYNQDLLNKQMLKDKQDPYLLVIAVAHDEVIVRYPDATTDRVPMAYIDTQHTLVPMNKQYWVDFTAAMEKQQFYNEAYNFVCEQYGFKRDVRYQHKYAVQEPEVAEPYYAQSIDNIPVTNQRLIAYGQIRDAIDMLISLEQ